MLLLFEIGDKFIVLGTINTNIGSLQSLTYLNLGMNCFSGKIFFDTRKLLSIILLLGTIPSMWDLMGSLTALYLDSNKFRGTIPSELSVLNGLNVLSMNGNNFNGKD